MLYVNFYDALTNADIRFIYRLVDGYRCLRYDDVSINSAMGMRNDGPRSGAYTGEQRVGMSVYELLECIRAGMPITSDQLHSICCMLQDVIDKYDPSDLMGDNTSRLYSVFSYQDATRVYPVLKRMYDEAHVQWAQALPLLADALLGHFGADCTDPDIWPDIKEYCSIHMPAANDWSMMLAWVMARTNNRELCDEVFSMADNMLDALTSK